MEDKILTMQEVMKMLKISYATAWRIRADIGGFRVSEKNWRFYESGVQRYIKSQQKLAHQEVASA